MSLDSGGATTAPRPQTPAVYRTAVVAADVLAAPGTVTASKQAGGSATAGTYNAKVVAGNEYGRTTPTAGSGTVITETTNLTGRLAFAAVTGATYYDIYFSVDADPKWVGRITEAQRGTGIVLSAVNTTAAGSIAGAVDIQVPGTGLQAAVTAAVNTAYNVPASPVDTSGFQYVEFDVEVSRSGDAVAPALTVVPFFQDATDSNAYFQGTPVVLSFGGTTGLYGALRQRLRVESRGAPAVALVVQSIAGTGAAVSIWSVRS